MVTTIASKRIWRLVAGTLLSLGLLWLASRGVSWVGVADALGSARWGLIAVGLGCVLLATLLRAWCWRRLLVATTVPLTFFQVWKILLIGQFLNICVPARAGDVARIYLLGGAAEMSKTGAATSLVLEKFFDATTLLLLLGPVSLLVDLPASLVGVRRGVAVAALLLPLAVIVLAWRGTALVELLERRTDADGGVIATLARSARTIVQSLAVLSRWQDLAVLQVAYLGVWFALVGVNYAVLLALDLASADAVLAAFVVMIVLQVGTAVPSTPGKIGVFQYLAVLALAPFGVAREPALTYGVLLHVTGFAPLVALGGFWSWTGLAGDR